LQLAIKNNDENTCKLVYDASSKQKCLDSLSKVNEQELMKTAINSKDVNKCNPIKTTELNSECKDIINLKTAIENKSKNNCDYIKKTIYKNQCKDFFNALESQKK
jgi:hypothetical protein